MKMRQLELQEILVGDFRLDADEIEFPDEHKGVVDQLKKREKSLIKGFKKAQEKLDSQAEDIKKLEAKSDILEKENKDLKEANENAIPAEKLDSAVRERATYLSYAKDYKVEGADGMTNDDIKKEIVKASGKVKAEKLDDQTYVNVAFDMLDHDFEKKRAAAKDNLENHSADIKDNVSDFDRAKAKRGA